MHACDKKSATATKVDEHHALSMPLSLGGGALRAVVKDNFDIAGLPTSCGSERLAGTAAATANAAAVSALLRGDVTIVGRARMHELAYGVTGINAWSGTSINPRHPDRIPGGSSSGCAVAVASGLADIALGTDTGGSIRVPAACCELFGLKTTNGLISRAGVIPTRSSLDCVGLIAADLGPIDQTLRLIAPAYRAGDFQQIKAIKVLRPAADEAILAAFDAVLEIMGLTVDLPQIEAFDEAFDAGLTIMGWEMWDEFSWLAPDFDGIGRDVAERLRQASRITCDQLEEARNVADRFTLKLDQLLGTADALLLPTLPCRPPKLSEAVDPHAQLPLTRLVRPFNVSGHPAISFPIPLGEEQAVNLQLVGPRGFDRAICDVASGIRDQIMHQTGVLP